MKERQPNFGQEPKRPEITLRGVVLKRPTIYFGHDGEIHSRFQINAEKDDQIVKRTVVVDGRDLVNTVHSNAVPGREIEVVGHTYKTLKKTREGLKLKRQRIRASEINFPA